MSWGKGEQPRVLSPHLWPGPSCNMNPLLSMFHLLSISHHFGCHLLTFELGVMKNRCVYFTYLYAFSQAGDLPGSDILLKCSPSYPISWSLRTSYTQQKILNVPHFWAWLSPFQSRLLHTVPGFLVRQGSHLSPLGSETMTYLLKAKQEFFKGCKEAGVGSDTCCPLISWLGLPLYQYPPKGTSSNSELLRP